MQSEKWDPGMREGLCYSMEGFGWSQKGFLWLQPHDQGLSAVFNQYTLYNSYCWGSFLMHSYKTMFLSSETFISHLFSMVNHLLPESSTEKEHIWIWLLLAAEPTNWGYKNKAKIDVKSRYKHVTQCLFGEEKPGLNCTESETSLLKTFLILLHIKL